MIGLARHIEYLLLHHDRVVIPGLGSFVTLYRAAQILPDGSSFLPPMRSVEFRFGEIGSDELLLRSVMRAGFMTRDEACRAIADEVEAIRRAAADGGEYRLGRLGRFVEADGQLAFCVDEANFVEYPRLGFAPVEVTLLEEAETEAEPVTAVEIKTSDRIYISLPRRVLRAAAVAAAVIVFLLMLSKPVNTPDTTVNYAGLLSAELFGTAGDTACVADVVEIEAVDATSSVASLSESGTEAVVSVPEAVAPDAAPIADTYYIIVSSLPSKRLAEKQIECFRQQGVSSDLHIYETPRKARLYVASFNDFGDARRYLSQLVEEQPVFANAWIMKAGD